MSQCRRRPSSISWVSANPSRRPSPSPMSPMTASTRSGKPSLHVRIYESFCDGQQKSSTPFDLYMPSSENGYIGALRLSGMEENCPVRCYEGMKVRNLIAHLDRYMDCDAMYELGYRYYFGTRMRPCKKKALYWFYNSAILGHETAMYMVGSMYATGDGCSPDILEAAYWFAQGAEAGDPLSMNSLAIMYAEGIGLEQSDDEARKLWEKA